MSISAAISAAPTKKLTSKAPHAGVRRSAPRGTSGWSARRRCSAKAAAATAAPRRYQRPRGEKTWILGSAVANARMTPPRASASSRAPTRSASTAACGPAAEVEQRPARGQLHTTSRTSAAIATRPIGVSQRPSPANGMNSWPQVRSRISWRAGEDERAGDEGDEREEHAERVEPASGTWRSQAGLDLTAGASRMAAARTSPTARLIPKIARQSATARHRAEQRAEDGADLLDRGDDAERHAAALGRVEVGDEGEGGRHQPAAADALEEAAGDHAGHVVGERGDQGAEGEDHQRHHQHRHPAAEVGDAADQRQHRDVAEQEAADDRGRALELVDRHPDAGHHVGEREHHDVGVGGGERHRDGGAAASSARPRGGHGWLTAR